MANLPRFSVVALAVKYNAPLLIFTGMVLAFALLMGAGVLVGCKLIKLIPKKGLRIFTGAIFFGDWGDPAGGSPNNLILQQAI